MRLPRPAIALLGIVAGCTLTPRARAEDPQPRPGTRRIPAQLSTAPAPGETGATAPEWELDRDQEDVRLYAPVYAVPIYYPVYPYDVGAEDVSPDGRAMGSWPGRRRGNVLLRIEPRDVRVCVNGMPCRTDGHGTLRLPDGLCRLEFIHPGYRTETLDLAISPGVAYRVERRLARLRPGRDAGLPADPPPGSGTRPDPPGVRAGDPPPGFGARPEPPRVAGAAPPVRVSPGFGLRSASPSLPPAPRATVPAPPPMVSAPPPVRVTPGFGLRPAPPPGVAVPPLIPPTPGSGVRPAPPPVHVTPGFGVRPVPVPPQAPSPPGGERQPSRGDGRDRRGRDRGRIPVPPPYYYAPYSPYPYYGYGYDFYGNPLGAGSPYYDYPGSVYPYPMVDTGDLSIDIHPDDARVYLDGHFLGLAREVRRLASLRRVLAGPHVVTTELTGYLPLRREIVVSPEGRARVRAQLQRE
jgi:PEGA domain